MGDTKKPHVLVIPQSTQGHLLPLVRFSKGLARKGVAVTFVSYEREISVIASGVGEEHNLQFISLPRPQVVIRSPKEASIMLEKSFQTVKEKLIHDQLAGDLRFTCVVADIFLPWVKDLALQLGVPRYMFVASGAVLVRFFQAVQDAFIQGKLHMTADLNVQKFDGKVSIHGLPSLQYHELPSTLLQDPVHFQARARNILEADGLLINTYYELEEPVLDTLRRPPESTVTKAQKFYPVGPLFPSSAALINARVVPGLEDSEEQCLNWLDSQPDSSVLYISFGTLLRLEPRQMVQIALALEISQQRFLWVIPLPKAQALDTEGTPPVLHSTTHVLPEGFEARLGQLGCIVTGWAPQTKVLSHRSVGVFLTHCGWNSSLEGASCGVPMLAFPISAEQHLNCRYLVDNLKIAVQIQRGADGVANAKEIERVVRLVMIEEQGREMKRRVEELKMNATSAVSVDGSGSRALQEFVDDIMKV